MGHQRTRTERPDTKTPLNMTRLLHTVIEGNVFSGSPPVYP